MTEESGEEATDRAAVSTQRLTDITLDDSAVIRRSPEVEHERAVAIYDLLEENAFVPVGDFSGPYHLHLSISENRLLWDIRTEAQESLGIVTLPLTPFRKVVKDYFMVCETYYEAIKTASPARIEAIDMGRRGLHNDGSELLQERLQGKIEIDFQTARRLFTLICVLQIRG
ncbi:UPF0262 family protein [Pelagibius litoralis]|uniref:UPF0262 protein HBA54_19740 n=1 Tax=Pelagibius litoralis TaxID=374515 RepID=A0A967F0P3_9PROT|nr:UPF0262 family protein [Pelagibius litoralis]NIA70836.1 UPF0262 family protein [Pelagibius litoralis]